MYMNTLEDTEVTESKGLERRARRDDRVKAGSRAEEVERDGKVCALVVRYAPGPHNQPYSHRARIRREPYRQHKRIRRHRAALQHRQPVGEVVDSRGGRHFY